MEERFPVGTRVQVKNQGHGSRSRTEAERVGGFTGTVIATNGPDYTGIPEVCVESETGERRVILVGDLEAAPEAVQDKLTDGMRQALLSTYTVGDHREFPTSTPGSTLRALVRRGLAKEPNPLENMGYALTLAGSAARHTLIKESEEPKTCGNVLRSARRLDGGPDEICVREAGHRGRRHRNNASVTAPGTVVWEDEETSRSGSVVEHKVGFQVKLWYRSGSMETIPGLEFMTAASLYGEGEDNPRVCAGEVHDSRGMLVASFERCVDKPGNRG